MTSFFQRLFGKADVAAPVRGPLGLHLNAGFTLNTLAFRLLEEALLIEFPGEEYTVAAISHIDLGGGSQIFRYYTSGEEFLQINTTGGSDIDDIDDIKFFVYAESYGISQKKNWQSAISPSAIGTPTLSGRKSAGSAFLTRKSRGTLSRFICWKKWKIISMPHGMYIILPWVISGRLQRIHGNTCC